MPYQRPTMPRGSPEARLAAITARATRREARTRALVASRAALRDLAKTRGRELAARTAMLGGYRRLVAALGRRPGGLEVPL